MSATASSGKIVGRKTLLVTADHAKAFRVLERGRDHERTVGAVHRETHREVGTSPALRLARSAHQPVAELGCGNDRKRAP